MPPHLNDTSEGFLGRHGMARHENGASTVGLLGQRVFRGRSRFVDIPLTGVLVEAEVLDFITEVKISQSYRNTENVPIEATYNFPVDEAAVVCGFEAHYEDGSIVKGVVKEKGEAKQEYSRAIRRGKQANILENVKRDIFTLRLGNLPPGESVKIVLTYVTTLKAQGDAAAFVLPTTIAPRYSPASSVINSEEAEAVSPPTTNVKLFGLTIRVKVSCRSKIKRISSPTHRECGLSCKIEGNSGNVAIKNIPMDRELILLIEEERAHQPRACVEISDDGSVAGLVTIFPQIEFKDLRREIIFVLDRSGSMDWTRTEGKSQMEQAKEALLIFLRSLPPNCTFDIVSFGSTYESLFRTPIPYSDETLEWATTHVMNMEANMGGTKIRAPLKAVLEQDLATGMERQVFVLTDGQVSNDLEVFETIRRGCTDKRGNKWLSWGKTGRCRVFSLGIGAGVSRHLVEGIAKAGGGTARFVEGGDSKMLCRTITEQIKQALQPALDEVSVTWNFPQGKPSESVALKQPVQPPVKTLLGYKSPSIDEGQKPKELSAVRIFPSVIPPVFNRERFLSFALFMNGSKGIPDSVTIKCNTPDGPLEETVDITDEEVFYGSVAHKMAAQTAISEYEDRRNIRLPRSFSIGQSSPVLSEEDALQLALDNGLASDATSFVAVLENPVVKAGRVPLKKSIPQYLPVRGPPAAPGYRGHGPPPPPRAWSHPNELVSVTGFLSSPSTRGEDSLENLSAIIASHTSLGKNIGDERCVKESCAGSLLEKSSMLSFERGNNGFLLPLVGWCLSAFNGSIGMCKDISTKVHLRRAFDVAISVCKDSGSGPLLLGSFALFFLVICVRAVTSAFGPMAGCTLLAIVGAMLHYFILKYGSSEKAPTAAVDKSMAPRPWKAYTPATNKSGTPAAPTNRRKTLARNKDVLLKLSLLQKADGSFALDERLGDIIGVPPDEAKATATKALGKSSTVLDDAQLATVLAVSILRKKFPKEKGIWELQEGKALDYLDSRGRAPHVSESFIDSLTKEWNVTKLD